MHIQTTQQAPEGKPFDPAEIAAKVGTMIPVFDVAVDADEAMCVAAYVSETDGSAWYTIDVPESAVNLRRG